MNYQRISSVFIIAALISLTMTNCRKDDKESSTSSTDTIEKAKTVVDLTSGSAKVYADTFSVTGDTLRSFFAMAQYIVEDPQVSQAFYLTNRLLEVHFKNGWQTNIQLMWSDQNGRHLSRGGDMMGKLKEHALSSQPGQRLKNNKVLVFMPYFDEFYSSYNPVLNIFNDPTAAVDVEVDVYKEFDANLAVLNTMDQYGLVILNTHGLPDAFLIKSGLTISQPGLNSMSKEQIQEKFFSLTNMPPALFESGQLRMSSLIHHNTSTNEVTCEFSGSVTYQYIKNSNMDLKDVAVFGNHCYSGFDHPLQNGTTMKEAWESRNAATYFGYALDNGISVKIDNSFCQLVERNLIHRLVRLGDSTGVAHLDGQGNRHTYYLNAQPDIFKLDVSVLKEYYKFRRKAERASSGTTGSVPYFINQHFDKGYEFLECDPAQDTFLVCTVDGYSVDAMPANITAIPHPQNYVNVYARHIGSPDIAIGLTALNWSGDTGTFAIGGQNSEWSAMAVFGTGATQQHYLSTGAPVNSGSITITEYCDSHISGSFQFQAAHHLVGGIIDITGGQFDVSF